MPIGVVLMTSILTGSLCTSCSVTQIASSEPLPAMNLRDNARPAITAKAGRPAPMSPSDHAGSNSPAAPREGQARTAARVANVRSELAPPDAAASQGSLALEISYVERIRVPRGSSLEVTITDSSGKRVFSKRSRTNTEAPSHSVTVPLAAGASYPLKVSASLTSTAGHHFSREVQIGEPRANLVEPVSVRLRSE